MKNDKADPENAISNGTTTFVKEKGVLFVRDARARIPTAIA
jgi:hypothetical protein